MQVFTYKWLFWNFLYSDNYRYCPYKSGSRVVFKLWWVPNLRYKWWHRDEADRNIPR